MRNTKKQVSFAVDDQKENQYDRDRFGQNDMGNGRDTNDAKEAASQYQKF